MTIFVLNGPNLGRLGTREPGIYGHTSYADLVRLCETAAAEADVPIEVRQTDHEGQLINWLHEATDADAGVVLNAGAWTHYSIAIRDAAAQLRRPWVELHISNVHRREPFRAHSVLSDIATGVIAGLGVRGYAHAIAWVAEELRRAETPG